MNLHTAVISALFSITPILELRGAIPYALAKEAPLIPVFLLCVTLNACVGPLVYLFLNTIHKLLSHIPLYNRMFQKLVDHSRIRIKSKVEKYGYIGLMLFVSIPLPITGAYTGTLGAWVLDMDAKKTFIAVGLGVVISGIIVSLVSYLGITALFIFIK